jgi:hypothetical protein
MKRAAILNPVARAMIVQQWKQGAVTGRIHALIGDDPKLLVKGAGRVFFVVLGACAACGIDQGEPDVRILMGAVNAVHEQVDEPRITDLRRASIVSGLAACERLLPRLTQRALADAAIQMEVRLAHQHVTFADFQILVDNLSKQGAKA